MKDETKVLTFFDKILVFEKCLHELHETLSVSDFLINKFDTK